LSSKILQLSPRSSTRIPRRKIAAQPSWGAAPASSLDMSLDLSLDMGFLRSWFESDSDLNDNSARPQFSLVCWAGVIWIVGRVGR
jgi:hypothetical protein